MKQTSLLDPEPPETPRSAVEPQEIPEQTLDDMAYKMAAAMGMSPLICRTWIDSALREPPPPQDDGCNERVHEALSDFIAGRR
jgi:hypothetical protein